MSRGLASLRGYQEGGEIPDVFAKMLAAIRSGASQQALPDSLKGRQRAQMMRDLDRFGADTTQINQKGIYDLFRGGELEELLELVSQMNEREASATRYGESAGPFAKLGVGTPPHGSDMYVSPHILEEDRPITVTPYSQVSGRGGFYEHDASYDRRDWPPPFHDEEKRTHSINLNLLHPFGTSYAPNWFSKATRTEWEGSPRENLRQTLLHELGHGIGEENRLEAFGLGAYKDEVDADNFAAILQAVLDSSPDDTRRDVLDEAQRLYWEASNAYKYDFPEDVAMRRSGWATPRQYSGTGKRDDPYVINPYYMETAKRSQRDQMRPFLERILSIPMYEGHHLNEPTAEEGLSGKWHRGIRSLRNLWDRVRS